VATETQPSQRKIRWSAPAPTQRPCSKAQPYRRRRPENTTLHRIVREHLETYLALAEEADPNHQLCMFRVTNPVNHPERSHGAGERNSGITLGLRESGALGRACKPSAFRRSNTRPNSIAECPETRGYGNA